MPLGLVGSAIVGIGKSHKMKALGVGMYGSEGVSQSKRYKQELDVKHKRVPGGAAPGALPMSAKEAMMKHLKKEAVGPKDVAKAFAYGLAISGSTAVVGGAAMGAASMYTKMQANRMFKTLQTREPTIRNNKKAREYFELIVAYAPSLMRHPNAIGDFLKRQLEYPMSSVEFIKQLADLEKTVSGTSQDSAPWQMGQNAARLSTSFIPKPMAGV